MPSALRPKASTTDSTVEASNHHFSGPRTMHIPTKKRAKTSTPTYTGPFVPSESLKYWLIYCTRGACCANCSAPSSSASDVGTITPPSGRALAPPLKLGTTRVNISARP